MLLWLIFAVFLFIVCAIMLVVEIFIPSFGLLTIIALSALYAGGAIFFHYGPVTGWVGIAIAAVLIPIIWVIVYRWFPNSRFGRHITLKGPERQKGDAIPDTNELATMPGKTGTVISSLRPVGMCDFDGKRLECVAETGYIEKEKKVIVIKVQGTQLTVRLADE